MTLVMTVLLGQQNVNINLSLHFSNLNKINKKICMASYDKNPSKVQMQ